MGLETGISLAVADDWAGAENLERQVCGGRKDLRPNRKQRTGNGEHETGNKKQGTGNEEQGREQETGNRKQETGRWEQETGKWEHGTGNRKQGTGNRLDENPEIFEKIKNVTTSQFGKLVPLVRKSERDEMWRK